MEKDENFFDIALESKPDNFDVAVTSINSYRGLGELNKSVLDSFNLKYEELDNLNLDKGFDVINQGNKTVLFIVTVGKGIVLSNLKSNLQSAFTTHLKLFKNKKVWIPLMGTGSGKLTFEESFLTTKQVLNEYKKYIIDNNIKVTISFPNENKAIKLFNSLNLTSRIDHDILLNKFLEQVDSNKNSFYLIDENLIDYDKSNIDVRLAKNDLSIGDIIIIKKNIIGSDSNSLYISSVCFLTKRVSKYFFEFQIVIDNLNVTLFNTYSSYYENINLIEKRISFILETFNKADLLTVIENYNILERISYDDKITLNNITTIPGIHSDTDNGEDYLDIKEDINAFARVMAAKSFQPPLAIALLGKWGSGKSFFMRKLKENIQVLSKENPQKAFCEGVAHVHFNAWSYMDANLWASIITRIFESLEEYINGLNLPQKEKKEIENELFQKLTISKEEHLELENQQNQVKKRLQELKTHKKNIKRELNNKISSIRNSTLVNIINKVDSDFKVQEQIQKTLNDNPTFVESSEKFEKLVPKKYWDNPIEFYNQLNSVYTFIKAFIHRAKMKTNIIWLVSIIVIVSLILSINYLLNLLTSWQDFRLTNKQWLLISIYGATFTRGIDTFLKLKKQIAPFWAIKEEYENKKEEAIFKFKQEQKAVKLEISQKKEEIIQVNKEIDTNLQLQANLKFKLENSLSTHALYTFIEKRANSDDYKKHLGIVSLIRKDFEILSGLLTDHQTELVSNEDSEEFKKLFNKPLERIILYIDDLDRCPEERVVEVLEAVNLLMAFPLFVVVVGVDPRWVKKALLVKYKNQFSGKEKTQEAISPSNYLEKIFQVPFHLKDADDKSIKNMIEKLATNKTNLIIEESIEVESNQKDKNNLLELTVDNDKITVDSESILINDNKGKTHIQSVEITNVEKIKALEISEKEIETIKSLTEIIGNNPRTIKRFINIYRIIKTHQDFNSQNDESILALIFLLSFSIGKYSLQFPELIVYINKGSFNSFDNLNNFFDYAIKQNKTKVTENDFIITNKFELLFEIIKGNNSEVLNLDMSLLEEQYNFIHRFTFKNI